MASNDMSQAVRRSRTAKEVADRLGISRSTVSRAFTPGAFVAEETRARVLSTAAEMGYFPNALARSMKSQRSNIVAIVLGDLLNPFHSMLAEALTTALTSAEMIALTVKLEPGQPVDSVMQVFKQYHVAAAVVTSINVSKEIVEACDRYEVPLLLLNRSIAGPETLSISSDLEQGGQLAAEHVIAEGARKIAIVRGRAGLDTSTARRNGYLAGLAETGVTPDAEFDGDYTYDGGMAAADALLGAGQRPEAVLCANDLSAFGFMDRARDRFGIVAPDDCLIVGFDGIPNVSWSAYSLTSVHLPINRMIARACETLEAIVAGEPVEKSTMLIPCRLVVRASSSRTAARD